MKLKKGNLTQAKLARTMVFDRPKAIAQLDPESYGSGFTHELGEYLESVLFGDGNNLDPLSPEDYQRFIKMLAVIEAEKEFTYLWMALTRFDFTCRTTLFNDLTAEIFGPETDVMLWADLHPHNTTPPPKEKYQLIAKAGAEQHA